MISFWTLCSKGIPLILIRNRRENSMKTPRISKSGTFNFLKACVHAPIMVTAVCIFQKGGVWRLNPASGDFNFFQISYKSNAHPKTRFEQNRCYVPQKKNFPLLKRRRHTSQELHSQFCQKPALSVSMSPRTTCIFFSKSGTSQLKTTYGSIEFSKQLSRA